MNPKPTPSRRRPKRPTAEKIAAALKLYERPELRRESGSDADDTAKSGNPVEDQTEDRSSE